MSRALVKGDIFMKLKAKLIEKTEDLKREVGCIWYAYHDTRIPMLPKIIIVICIGYAASPIDLIPDFIPVIGYLDDLLVVPALIALAVKLIPGPVMEDARKKAAENPVTLKTFWIAGVIIIILWLLILFPVIRAVVKMASHAV
jgi:uncharacterized membrane protein YkvA (DUF1232 family)